GTDECAFYTKLYVVLASFMKYRQYVAYTILPTFACNARCVYCYEEGAAAVSMSPETVRDTVRFILDTRKKDSTVILRWFGGEPLLRPDIIDGICRGLKENGVEYKSTMISNGSLITEEIIGKMRGEWNLVHIQISLDGAECDYIRRKNYYKYDGYYRKVMANTEALSAAGIAVGVRLNVDHENIGDVPTVIDDLARAVTHKKNVTLHIAPLYQVRAGENDLEIWRRIGEYNGLIEKAGFKYSCLLGLQTQVSPFKCMACDGSGMVVIMPDGRLSKCEHCPDASIFGDIRNGVTDPAALKAFSAVGPTREKCRACAFLPDCTSFSNCPVQDTHCREVRLMNAEDDIRQMYRNKLRGGTQDRAEESEEEQVLSLLASD
ncbi:MAG: radical SAM protein, partial [Clostridia bacterium]|nr:radical SAM protein [Clostridia bacterium]